MSIGALMVRLKPDPGKMDVAKLKDTVSALHAVDDIMGANTLM